MFHIVCIMKSEMEKKKVCMEYPMVTCAIMLSELSSQQKVKETAQ